MHGVQTKEETQQTNHQTNQHEHKCRLEHTSDCINHSVSTLRAEERMKDMRVVSYSGEL